MDLIMGTFAESHVPGLGEAELDLYEELLHTPDPDVYDWVSGQKSVPANVNNSVIEKLLKHDYAKHCAAKDNQGS